MASTAVVLQFQQHRRLFDIAENHSEMLHQPQLCFDFGNTENRFVAAQIVVVDLYLKP
jgi:hypothetical protein